MGLLLEASLKPADMGRKAAGYMTDGLSMSYTKSFSCASMVCGAVCLGVRFRLQVLTHLGNLRKEKGILHRTRLTSEASSTSFSSWTVLP